MLYLKRPLGLGVPSPPCLLGRTSNFLFFHMHMLVEWNKDIDIFNAKKQNRPKELQIETKKCLP